VGKPKGKRPLRRPLRRWVDNIRMDLGEVRWGDVDWIGLAQDRDRWRALANSVLNLRVPWNAGKLSSGLTSSGLSSSAQLHRVSELVSDYWIPHTVKCNPASSAQNVDWAQWHRNVLPTKSSNKKRSILINVFNCSTLFPFIRL
jgi:hypothetical protein